MLEIKNVSVEFKGATVKAVDNMNMTLNDGSRTSIVGETGSGKSVLIVALLRLLPPNAQISGEVLLNGENIMQSSKKRLCQIRGGLMSYVPQGGGASMNPLFKVGHQVGEPLIIHKRYTKKKAMETAVKLFERFNLTPGKEIAKAYPHQLSGGMRQRAMVAMGISCGAKIILADEPTKGLDDRRVRMVIDAMNLLEDETLLCVTHDILFAKAVSEKICVMYAAQQLEYGSTEDILKNPLHPYTQDLINAMPENGMKYESNGFAPPHESYLDEYNGCRYKERCSFRTKQCDEVPPITDIKGHKVRCWKYAL